MRQSLNAIRDKHNVFLEITDTGAVFIDAQGRVLDANAEYIRLAGYHELGNILGRSVTEWTAEYDRARNGSEVQKCIGEGPVHGLIVDYQWRDGTIVPVEINASTLTTATGTFILAVCRDIGRRRGDEQLMMAQRDLALALGTTYDLAPGLRLCLLTAIRVSQMDCGGIYLLDPITGELAMKVHEGLSDTFADTVRHYDTDSPKMRLIMRGIPVYERYLHLAEVLQAAQHAEHLHAFAVIPLQCEGKVVGCMNVASRTRDEVPQHARIALEAVAAQTANALERLRLLHSLREERSLFTTGPVVVVKWRKTSDQPPQFISRNMADHFGYAPDQFVSNDVTFTSIIHPDDLPRISAETRQYAAEKRPWYELEYRIRHANGAYRWVYDFTVEVRDETGAVSHFLGYIQDVTDWKRTEDERRAVGVQMLHAQKLESLGVLAGGIAHDFNNILMAILGNIDLAMMGTDPGTPVSKNLHDAERASRRAADLCRQMLAYAGRGSYQPRPLNVSEVIEDMRRMLGMSVSKNVQLSFALEDALPAIEADLSQFHQVVMNLVINASEAVTASAGEITIRTGRTMCDRACLDDTLLGDTLAPGAYVFIEVQDTGCGMDSTTQTRMFDPFFTTKSTGRGLGLAAVLGIVRAHHGTLRVLSTPGRGSTFRVLLPASAETAKPLAEPGTQDAEWRGAGTLLLVDDEETVRMVGAKMLEVLGFTVLIASSGPSAIEIFRTHADEIVGVVLDLTMPQMGGDEVFPLLRAIKADVPVLLASGYSEQELTRRLSSQGYVGFLQKPYTVAMLAAKLRATMPGCTAPGTV